MKVLTINAGSSSMKYQLIDLNDNQVLIKGLVESIGLPTSAHSFEHNENKVMRELPIPDHHAAFEEVLSTLTDPHIDVIKSLDEVDAVGHRIVSGGEYFAESILIDEDVIEKIGICSQLAPLHNPGALTAINACRDLMPDKPSVAVFDTAFFQTLPPRAYIYPIPYEYYTEQKIRVYGAHGTSHRYVSLRAAAMLGAEVSDLKLITCHIGNGASISAVEHGIAIDTSMGLTPLDGLMMGTRCGSIDPAVVTTLQMRLGYTPQEMDTIMNKKSGLLGVSGISSDLRAIEAAAAEGQERAELACEIYTYYIKRYISQYYGILGGADAIVFTAGVGENSDFVRSACLAGLEHLGIAIDHEKNKARGGERDISAPDSKVKILVIPTNEELMIARDVERIVG